MSDRPSSADCDVVVLGAGPAGLATAIGLRQTTDLDVVVVEAGDDPVERFGETAPPDILLPLQRLGLRDAFRSDGHLPCPGSISVWGRAEPGHNDFILNPLGPAWHLSRARFEAMLRARAAAVGASLRTRTRFVDADHVDADHVEADHARTGGCLVVLRHRAGGERHLRASWVVDATGWRAVFARHRGASPVSPDAMLAVVRFARIASGPLSSQTMVEARPEGWWYAARLPGDRVVTVLVTDRGGARSLTLDGHARWRVLLASTTLLSERLHACDLTDERFRSYPVTSTILDRVEAPGWLAVGDAASSYDPIASQGIYKALVDAEDATATIAAALGRTETPRVRYTDRVAARYADYVGNRAHLYDLEQRWADAPFWRRRARAVGATPPVREGTASDPAGRR